MVHIIFFDKRDFNSHIIYFANTMAKVLGQPRLCLEHLQLKHSGVFHGKQVFTGFVNFSSTSTVNINGGITFSLFDALCNTKYGFGSLDVVTTGSGNSAFGYYYPL